MSTPGELINRYLELRDMIAYMEDSHKATIKPYKEALETIENALLAQMHEQDVVQIKSDAGTAFQNKWMSVKTVDKMALMNFVKNFDQFDLLTAAVSKEALKEFLERSDNVPPPGVDVSFGIKVQIRKAS